MRKFSFLLLIFCLLWCISCDQKAGNDAIDWRVIQRDIDDELWTNILDKWYPAILDTVEGGYLSNMSVDFTPLEDQDKMIVTQARHVWSTAKVASSTKNESYLEYSRHGFQFLKKMWDKEYGGFYQEVDRSGIPLVAAEYKTAYGNAFAIYALSAYFHVSGDSASLELAKQAFNWLEIHSYDRGKGGYFQNMTREGVVIPRSDTVSSTSTLGYKDQNSSIHLLEAFTELYHVWPNELVKERLSEMFFLIKDVMINDRHYLNLFFTPNLQPISYYEQDSATIIKHAWIDHVSFGHDIETAYLLLEAAEALEIHIDGKLLLELKNIVDHALLGLNSEKGGLYDQGYYFDHNEPIVIIKDSKEWWAQAEALNTLLIFHQFFPRAGYDIHFVNQWNYIKKYLIDNEYGGWYIHGIDTRPSAKKHNKASIWKSTYHNYRALANISKRLKNTKNKE